MAHKHPAPDSCTSHTSVGGEIARALARAYKLKPPYKQLKHTCSRLSPGERRANTALDKMGIGEL